MFHELQIISMIVSLLLAVCSAGNIMSSSSDAKSGSKKLKKGSQNAIESNGNPTTVKSSVI